MRTVAIHPANRWLRLVAAALLGAALLGGTEGAEAAEARRGRSRAGAVQGGPAEQLDAALSELATLKGRFEALRRDVGDGPLGRSPAAISARFNDAVYAYLTGEYDRAALLFYSLLEHQDLRGRPEEPEAQWYLAECLYQARNYHAARTFFDRVVAAGPSHPFYDDSLLKLIEVHGLVGDLAGFRSLYEAHRGSVRDQSTPAAMRVRYAMGRALYQAGEYELARGQFADFPRGSALTPMARYFAGTLKVRDGQIRGGMGDGKGAEAYYREALPMFEEVLALPASTDDHRRVQDLAALALGRLRFELGEYPEAMAAYQRVGHDSDAHADALYEMCWAWVRQGDISQAASAARSFLAAFAGHLREPEVRMLLADLQVQAQRYDEAGASYRKVADDYQEVKDRLDRLAAGRSDPMALFNALVEQALRPRAGRAGGEGELPEYASRVAREDARLARAVDATSDLREQEADIAEGQEILAAIEESLGSTQGESLLTGYRVSRREVDAIEAIALQLDSRLVQTEAEYLGSRGVAAGDLASARAELARGTAQAAQMDQDVADHKEDWQLQARAIATRASRLEDLSEDLLARLAGLELAARAAGGDALTLEQIASLRTDLRQAAGQAAQERGRLDPAQLTAGYEVAGAQAAREANRRLREQAQSLESRLRGLRSSVGDPAAAEFFRRVDEARDALTALRAGASATRSELARLEAREIEEIRRVVAEERRNLGLYAEEAVRVDAQSMDMAAAVAGSSFHRVADRIDALVMRADAGAADVYWFEMEAIAAEKRSVQDEQNRKLRSLQSAFREVLQDQEEP